MTKLLYIVLLALLFHSEKVSSQVTVYNNGVAVTNVSSNIYINGNLVNDSTGNIANGGNIFISGDLTNNANNHLFVINAGKVTLNGTNLQTVYGDSSIHFHELLIEKPANDVKLNQAILVRDTLRLLSGNIHLNGNNIELLTSGTLYGEDNSKRIYGTSGLVRAKRLLSNTNLSENIGGLGIYLSASSNFGMTTIERGHTKHFFAGDSSLFRYFTFIPSYPGHIDTLLLTYLDASETIPGEAFYKIFNSTDNGISWGNKGGLVNIVSDYVSSTTVSPPDIGAVRFTIFPTANFATCLPNDPDYISAIFLVSSNALNGDSVKFVQLSTSSPITYSWNFGDGITSSEDSPFHQYFLANQNTSESYEISMMVTNGICSDTRKKNIDISPNPNNLKYGNLYNGIQFVKLYPNPCNGTLIIEVKTVKVSDIGIEVCNGQGIIMDRFSVQTSSYKDQLDYSHLAPGLYYVKFQVGEEIQVIKIVKL